MAVRTRFALLLNCGEATTREKGLPLADVYWVYRVWRTTYLAQLQLVALYRILLLNTSSPKW